MAASISASVGQHGVNRYADVIQVQRLLNTAGAGLKDEGSCGTITIQAIKDYQKNFLPNPDGRVDPGGATWRHLPEGKLRVKREPLVILPQVSGQGYYPYAITQRQYGTNKCVKTLLDVCISGTAG